MGDVKCWLCEAQITTENSASRKKLVNVCTTCNTVYSMILAIQKLTKEELELKIENLNTRVRIHKAVMNNLGMRAVDVAKKFYREV